MTLYMTELSVADWPAALAWFRDVLGLPVKLVDEPRKFALLGGERGRLALVGREDGATESQARLVFLVEDLDASRLRLEASGVAVGDEVEDHDEGYRSLRVDGPDGIKIRLFEWIDSVGIST